MKKFPVEKAARLDKALRALYFSGSEWISRANWDDLIREGKVYVNGKVMKKPGNEVGEGSIIEIDIPDFIGLAEASKKAPLFWLSKQKDYAFFLKDPGVSSVALSPWEQDCFVNQVCAGVVALGLLGQEEFAALADPPILEGGLVQRLDRDTSGLVCVALTKERKHSIRKLFSEHKIEKEYLAIVQGNAERLSGSHSLFLVLSAPKVKVSEFAEGAQQVSAKVEVLQSQGDTHLVCVRTSFGARHIVRVLLSYLGAPLVGDALYGGVLAEQHFLHANRISANALDAPMEEAPLPETFLACLAKFGLHYSR